MKSDGRARLSLVHESFSLVCGQKANMGICHSAAHFRVAVEGRSSRSIFPVDTVWGDLLLTCSYRTRGGLGLECNHSRARQGQRQCSEIYISSGHCVVTTRYSKWTYWHCLCTPRLCGKGISSVRLPLANHFLPWLAFFKCLHRNTQRFAAQFFDHLEWPLNPTSAPAPAFLTLKTYALAKIPIEPSGACFCVPPTQSSERPFLNVCLSHGV